MKIVVLDGYTVNPGDNSWEPIEPFGELIGYDRTPPELTVERASGADILLTNKTVLDAATLDQLDGLRMISVLATGFNVVDVRAARKKGIPVCNVPEYSTPSVAQHVMAMILAHRHRPWHHDQAVRTGQWNETGDFCFWLQPWQELQGQTFGVIGFGRIGQATARLAHAFGMRVLAYNHRPKDVPGDWFTWASMDQVLQESDIVSLHCPLTESTDQMVDAALLAKMKNDAILVNASRGGLVNEPDLARALADGQIAAALLDVLSTEPPAPDNPLLTAPNCLITPHMAWSSIDARRRLIEITAGNIRAFLEGVPIHVVN